MKTKVEYLLERWGKWGKMPRRRWTLFDTVVSLRTARRFAGWDRKEQGYKVRIVKVTTIEKRRILK